MKEKKICRALTILLTLCILAMPPAGHAENDDIASHPDCPICGMDRQKFAHSRMLIHYDDGSRFGACSLHCTALELAYRPGKVPLKIEVADLGSHALVDVEAATWVIGGNRMGVMTGNAKWAFATTEDARRFIAEHGGKIADFKTAVSAAYAEMHTDTLMIREKRKQMKHMKSGQTAHGQKAKE